MNNYNTHTIVNYPGARRSILSRNLDGMVIAVRQETKVAYGEDPRNQDQRSFTDETYAMIFLRRIASLDQGMIKGNRCKHCGDSPSVRVVCVTNDGVHEIEHNAVARIEEVDGEPRVRVN